VVIRLSSHEGLCGAAAPLRSGAGRATLDRRAVAREVDRLVLLVPADAIALVARATEHLDDLPAARRSATDLVDRDPIAGSYTGTRFDGS
jgi:hypothetical protein